MDDTDIRILEAVQQDARVSIAELSRRTGLTERGAHKRLRKLEDEGVVTGYHAEINPAKVGFPVRAYLCVKAPSELHTRLIATARGTAGIREVHHSEDAYSFVMRVVARDEDGLVKLVRTFEEFGTVECARILSTPVEKHTT